MIEVVVQNETFLQKKTTTTGKSIGSCYCQFVYCASEASEYAQIYK